MWVFSLYELNNLSDVVTVNRPADDLDCTLSSLLPVGKGLGTVWHDICNLYDAPCISDGKSYHAGCMEDGVILAVEDGDSTPFAGIVCSAG